MSTTTGPKRSYKSTLNLPKTTFAMKANLVQNEPASHKRWSKMGLYTKIRQARHGSQPYDFHDGPPYANGSIHLGHLLNKVLKDLIVRSKTLAGYDCPYIPGWDCHGLPIEHKVVQELGDKARDMNAMQIRHRCKKAADKFVKLQSTQMQRLSTLADYDHPYLTMTPDYEAAVLEVFADLVEKGLVYRALKPVHWSIANQTALADAELEYHNREDTSVYVLFEITDRTALPSSLHADQAPNGMPIYLMIWTTTPWTLPANLAVAIHPRSTYGLYDLGESRYALLATEMAPKVLSMTGDKATATAPQSIGICTGKDLTGMSYHHPFLDNAKTRRVVTAEYVTLEDGTGLVHTAPGHGVEDYQTGLRENLDIYCPVREDGTFNDTVPDWLRGVDVWKANDLVVDRLRQSGHLFHDHVFTHSYPHDWRSKTPVIFRATEQWFVGVDQAGDDGESLRRKALTATQSNVDFIPAWGRNRMRGMLESRPDWCISRQRAWGLPIPAFLNNTDTSQYLLTPASVRAVSAKLRQHGSDYWFTATPEELLSEYDSVRDPNAPDWLKSQGSTGVAKLTQAHDIFDVWFESGSSWHAVLRQRDLGYPADLYLEGSDQHRGWFQLSLLPALGATGQAPFRGVLTHGFMVDRDGKKMSKSLGNALEVDTLLKDYGADVCRWWVAGLNTDNDIKVDPQYFKTAGEEYRKVRNTIRFLLSNLSDFDPSPQNHAATPRAATVMERVLLLTQVEPTTLDAWALGELSTLITQVRQSYDDLRFRKAHEAIFHYCNETLSAVYLVAAKDRLYCDAPDSPRRRLTQATLFVITDALALLLAPILPHTADEAWRALHRIDANDTESSVHLQTLPDPLELDITVDERWATIMAARQNWLKAIEQARNTPTPGFAPTPGSGSGGEEGIKGQSGGGIDNPLDCGLVVPASTLDRWDGFDLVDFADLCGVSRFETSPTATSIQVTDLRHVPRCERSWKRDATVKERGDAGMLSDRDAAALGL